MFDQQCVVTLKGRYSLILLGPNEERTLCKFFHFRFFQIIPNKIEPEVRKLNSTTTHGIEILCNIFFILNLKFVDLIYGNESRVFQVNWFLSTPLIYKTEILDTLACEEKLVTIYEIRTNYKPMLLLNHFNYSVSLLLFTNYVYSWVFARGSQTYEWLCSFHSAVYHLFTSMHKIHEIDLTFTNTFTFATLAKSTGNRARTSSGITMQATAAAILCLHSNSEMEKNCSLVYEHQIDIILLLMKCARPYRRNNRTFIPDPDTWTIANIFLTRKAYNFAPLKYEIWFSICLGIN